MLHIILTALLPVFLGLGLGYFAGKRRLVDNQNVASLNVLLMQFALPLTLFVSMANTPASHILGNGKLALVLMLSILLVYFPVLYLERRHYQRPLGDAAVQALTTAVPNYASIALPLLLPVFGADAALPVAIAIAVGAITVTPLTLALLGMHIAANSGQSRPASALRQFSVAFGLSLRKPIVVAPALGLLVSLSGWSLPPLVVTALGPMTTATAGIGLFLTGLMLSAQPIRISANVSTLVGVKNILQPLITLALVWLFALPETVGHQAVLLATIPAGFFGLVFGASAGVRSALAGTTLVLSSVSSILTLSLVLWWLAR